MVDNHTRTCMIYCKDSNLNRPAKVDTGEGGVVQVADRPRVHFAPVSANVENVLSSEG